MKAAGSRAPDRKAELLRWAVALALLTPVILLYAAHYLLLPEGLFAHGFIQYDQPYYMANAREHFDNGFSLLYGLPFSPDYDTPQVYFQPLSLAFGAILELTGVDPGALYVGAGLLFGLACLRLVIALYETLFGLAGFGQRLGLVLFVWGGGVFALAGAAYMAWKGLAAPSDLMVLEPASGWWFFNFGRNLVYPTEALYHLLAVAILLLLLRKHNVGAVFLCLLLSLSHPYAGLQVVLAVFVWAGFERYFLRREESAPRWFVAALGAVLFFHLAYYLGVLATSEEHRQTVALWQKNIPGLLDGITMALAYALVGGLALWRLRDRDRAAAALALPHNRLFLFYFLISFALANHEFLISAHQPIHFARGHIWMPLFLLGAPILIGLLDRIWNWLRPWLRWTGLAAVVSLFLLDNLAFFAIYIPAMAEGPTNAPTISRQERELLRQLDDPRFEGYLLVSAKEDLGYLATVYTPLRAWVTHGNNQPSYEANRQDITAWLTDDQLQPEWRDRDVVYVVPKEKAPYDRLPWVTPEMEILDTPADYVLIVSPRGDGG